MRRRRWLVGVGAATFFVAYIGSFGLVINTIGLTYLEGDPSPPPSRGYYFANDRTTNRSLYYFYYPLATCYGWIADAVFLETPPFCLESSGVPGTPIYEQVPVKPDAVLRLARRSSAGRISSSRLFGVAAWGAPDYGIRPGRLRAIRLDFRDFR